MSRLDHQWRWLADWPTPSFLFDDDGLTVRAHPDFLKYVVFLGLGEPGKFHPIGTGCLIALRYEGLNLTFLVTAAHVLDGVKQFTVRANLKAGGSDTIPMSIDDMMLHPNPDNDIAVFPISINPDKFDFKVLAFERAKLSEKSKFDVGHGDFVHAIGLYTSHHGFTKNIPVVRTGTIAALLDEPVLSVNNRYVEAYLVDLRTIAGLSGSPVFLMPPAIQFKDGRLASMRTPPTIPLGVLLAYHLVAHADDQIVVPRHPVAHASAPDSDGFMADERNTGFGVVVPFERVAEILNADALWERVARAVTARKEQYGRAKPAAT